MVPHHFDVANLDIDPVLTETVMESPATSEVVPWSRIIRSWHTWVALGACVLVTVLCGSALG